MTHSNIILKYKELLERYKAIPANDLELPESKNLRDEITVVHKELKCIESDIPIRNTRSLYGNYKGNL